MHQIPNKLITASIVNFCEMSDLGRSKVYELLDAGDLDSIKIGKRRLIVLDSYYKLIERQRAAGATTRISESQSPATQPTDAAAKTASHFGKTRGANSGDLVGKVEGISAGIPRQHQKSDDPHPHPPWAGKATPFDSDDHRARNKIGTISSAHTGAGDRR